MTQKQIVLIVAAVTVVINLIFAISGVTSTVSCTVTSAAQSVWASVTNSN